MISNAPGGVNPGSTKWLRSAWSIYSWAWASADSRTNRSPGVAWTRSAHSPMRARASGWCESASAIPHVERGCESRDARAHDGETRHASSPRQMVSARSYAGAARQVVRGDCSRAMPLTKAAASILQSAGQPWQHGGARKRRPVGAFLTLHGGSSPMGSRFIPADNSASPRRRCPRHL